MELAQEKDNENAMLKHQCDLKERLKDLNYESMKLENRQKEVSLKI